MKTLTSIVILLILCSCTSTPEDHKLAEYLCKNNGGWLRIEYDIYGETLTCRDGAKFGDLRYSYEYMINEEKESNGLTENN